MSGRISLISAAVAATLLGCTLEDPANDHLLVNAEAEPLVWLGDTHLRVGATWLPPTLDPAASHDLEIYTQSYPAGAAQKVELFWADASYAVVDSVAMTLDADHVGPFARNTQWRATVPGAALIAGEPLYYWIRAEDTAGNVLWDSRDGQNYTTWPRDYAVGWVGGFGSYRPVDGSYVEGGLFNDDQSTSTGCWNHGASMSSYRARAARVWIPGLTDRDFANSDELAAAVALVSVELFTDGQVDGWTGLPARFARRVGNDFLYSFQLVSFNPGCIVGLGDGTYSFKLRVSTTGGHDWFWRGTENGPGGGDDLRIQYAGRCSYFNDPLDCIPTETDLTRAMPGGPVLAWAATPIGATSTYTKELLGGERPVIVTDIAIAGPDAEQFGLEVFDVGANQYVDAAGPFTLEAGDELRLILVHAPSAASVGVLPQQATVTWTETTTGPPQSLEVQGIFLRGRTQ